MTEAEWLVSADPMPMLEFLEGKASDRKLRLLGVAIARESWDDLLDDRSRRAVEMAEEFADGKANASDLETASEAACDARDEQWDRWPRNDKQLDLSEVAYATASPSLCDWLIRPLEVYPFWRPLPTHCGLIRDIFGNPYKPVALDPSWRTEAVVGLAEGIYHDHAFDRMPVLADALEDAGCSHGDILNHCRGDGPHVKGCWVVDLLTGRK
jgi:hypothetical protein